MRTTIIRALSCLLVLGFLAGCQSQEERAEGYYQSALSLVEAGDVDRALVELRNVFDNDGFHEEARRLYADLVLARGRVGEAYGQYMRLVEQNPDLVEIRQTLAEMAMGLGNWDEVTRHGQAAVTLAPGDPRSQALATVLDYREAVLAEDDAAAARAAETAAALLETAPDLLAARRIVVDHTLKGPDPAAALPDIETVIAAHPDDRSLRFAKLQILLREGRSAEVAAELREMYRIFPEDDEIRGMLIQSYLAQDDTAGAEAFLREEAGADDADPEGHLAVVSLLTRTDQDAAAMAELDRLAAANAGSDLGRYYRTLAASMQFAGGAREAAIAEVRAALEGAGGSDRINDARMVLVRMLLAGNDTAAAEQVVAEVLAEDPTQVEALKLRAGWHLRDGTLGEASVDLRNALDQAPRDSEVLMLMGQAQQAAGNIELAQQRLALAVEASGSAPREALFYARFLIGQEDYTTAEAVLSDSSDRNPDNLDVAGLLGTVLLRTGRTAEVAALQRRLAAMDDPRAQQLSRSLEAATLLSQDRVEDSLDFLRNQVADSGNSDTASVLQVLRIQLQTGRVAEARRYIDELRATDPDNTVLAIFDADLKVAEGEGDAALDLYTGIIDDTPAADLVVQKAYRLLSARGDPDAAAALLERGLEAAPESVPLGLLRAAELERDGEIDTLRSLYATLYDRAPNNLVITNNYASVLASYSEDAEDLALAERIARKLAAVEDPAVRDTLGWIRYRRQDYAGAVRDLEIAARGLPDDPLVALHYGLALAAVDRPDEARTQLERGLELAGDRPLPQVEAARKRLATLPE